MKKGLLSNRVALKTLKNPPVFFVLFFSGFLWMSCSAYWVFSEVYPSMTARYLLSPDRIYYLFSLKPLYNFLLFISFHISSILNMYPVLLNRIFFAFNGAALSFLLYGIIKKKTDSFNALTAVLILISSHIFLTRGFRIRSDLLISTLGLLAVWLSLKSAENKTTGVLRENLVFGLLLCMLLVSPKSVYWLGFAGFLVKESSDRTKKQFFSLKKTGLFFAGTILLSFAFQDPFFIKALKNSALFYMNNLKDTALSIKTGGLFTPWGNEFSFFSDFMRKNPQIILTVLLKAGFVFHQTALFKERKWSVSDTSFAILLFFSLFHPQQKPFFLCALTPWFLLHFFTDPFFTKHRDRLYSPLFKKGFLLFLFCYAGGALFFRGGRVFKIYNNFEQRAVIQQVEGFFKTLPSLRIYNPSAFLIHPHSLNWFLGPYESHRVPLKQFVENHKIDVILHTPDIALNRLLSQNPTEETGWTNVQSHIYYRSLQIPVFPGKKISGQILLKKIEEKISSRFKEKNRRYWYMFLNEYRRPVPIAGENETCPATVPDLFPGNRLKPYCAYRREDFMKGVTVPAGSPAHLLAVFYIPPPAGVSKEISVISLLIYDIFL